LVRFLMGKVPLYPADTIHRLPPRASRHFLKKDFFVDNLLVRIHSLIGMKLVDRPCAHGSLDSHFLGRLIYLPRALSSLLRPGGFTCT
jgi:hypothetical protein